MSILAPSTRSKKLEIASWQNKNIYQSNTEPSYVIARRIRQYVIMVIFKFFKSAGLHASSRCKQLTKRKCEIIHH